jgi:hypothetical protein
VEGWQAHYDEFFEKASGFGPKRITLGIYRQMGSGLKVFLQKCGLQPMRWQRSVRLGKETWALQLPGANRVEPYNAIREMVGRSWARARMPELALCKKVETPGPLL